MIISIIARRDEIINNDINSAYKCHAIKWAKNVAVESGFNSLWLSDPNISQEPHHGRIAVLPHIGAESSYFLFADNFNAKIWMLSLMHKSSYHLNAKSKKVTQFVSITVYNNKVSYDITITAVSFVFIDYISFLWNQTKD